MPIKILNEETINKIAAGEVVERASNVVKELVENSLDAQSSDIEIEIKEAGRELIRVRDNGTGMSSEDITLAFIRHATSKINDFTDLEKIYSMGFRGEALPSIAAVSKFTAQSQKRNENSGWEIKLSGSKIVQSNAWSGSYGTNIEVRDLFFNTPARAKFLKSDTTERHRILHTIEEISLAWPEVSFKVISEGKVVLQTPKVKNPFERIIDVLGKEFGKSIIPLEVNHPFLKIKAYITRTENSLASKNHQMLFVNRRPINMGRFLVHSLYEAYRENLPSGRHPGAIIYFEIKPSEIDANIHPAKREIRFSNEQEIHDLFYKSIKNAVSLVPAASYINSGLKPTKKSFDFAFYEPKPVYNKNSVQESGIYSSVQTDLKQNNFLENLALDISIFPIGQVFGLFVVAQYNNDLLIIDQHAAAERIRYENYLKQLREKNISVQQLLIPATIELLPSQIGLLRENLALLENSGWDIEEFGTNTFRIKALPSVLGNTIEVKIALTEILLALAEDSKIVPEQKIEKIIRAACHASIKAGDSLSKEESNRLLKDLFLCESPYTCPHGRPVIFKIQKNELEKFFGRKK